MRTSRRSSGSTPSTDPLLASPCRSFRTEARKIRPRSPTELAHSGSLRVGNWRAGTVSRVNPVSFGVKTFPTGNAPNGLTATPDGRVWVGIAARPPDFAATLEGDVAHFVLREDWLDQNDPGTAWSSR